MARIIQVFEHEALTTSADAQGRQLEPTELEQLFDFNDRNGNKYFTGIRQGVKFTSFVGVIQIGGLTLEILPKADRQAFYTKQDYNIWRKVLLGMLTVCGRIRVDTVSEASLNRHHNSLLDLYFILFLDEVNHLMHKGLIKKYRRTCGNLYALKGRIVFPCHIRENLIHKERVFTEHQVYDHEHLLNQILLKGLTILSTISHNPVIRDRIHRIMLDFPEIQEIHISKEHFENLRFHRKSEPYRRAIDIARMIILNYRPDLRAGRENMLALLFDMNQLWEEYIFRMLKRCEHTKIKVNEQVIKAFWEERTIRPDLVISQWINGIEKRYIIDTKWKILDSGKPSDEDLKQMFVYNLYWEAEQSILLYPKTLQQSSITGDYAKLQQIPGTNRCTIGFVEVIRNNALNPDIGNDVLGLLNRFEEFDANSPQMSKMIVI